MRGNTATNGSTGGASGDSYRSLPAELIVLLLSDQHSTAELISSGLADNGFTVRIAQPHDGAGVHDLVDDQ